MSLCLIIASDWDTSFPRVSGDEPACMLMMTKRCRFSPRERG